MVSVESIIFDQMEQDLKSLLKALVWPVFLWLAMLVIFLLQEFYDLDFRILAVHPQHIDGLLGILGSPFLHLNWGHIFSNSIPFLVLGWALFFFYKEFAFKALFWMWVSTGFWVWIFASPGYHLGASGVVYALAFFHISSGIIRKVYGLLAFGMLVIFLYGGLIWGFFPELFPKERISWESHLMGAIAGIAFAIYYRKSGIQKEEKFWDDEEDDEDEMLESPYKTYIKYHYTPKEKPDNAEHQIDEGES